MANGAENGGFRTVRQSLSALLGSVAAVMIAADSLGIGRKVDPLTLTITLTASLALVGVDLRDALRDIVGRGK